MRMHFTAFTYLIKYPNRNLLFLKQIMHNSQHFDPCFDTHDKGFFHLVCRKVLTELQLTSTWQFFRQNEPIFYYNYYQCCFVDYDSFGKLFEMLRLQQFEEYCSSKFENSVANYTLANLAELFLGRQYTGFKYYAC